MKEIEYLDSEIDFGLDAKKDLNIQREFDKDLLETAKYDGGFLSIRGSSGEARQDFNGNCDAKGCDVHSKTGNKGCTSGHVAGNSKISKMTEKVVEKTINGEFVKVTEYALTGKAWDDQQKEFHDDDPYSLIFEENDKLTKMTDEQKEAFGIKNLEDDKIREVFCLEPAELDRFISSADEDFAPNEKLIAYLSTKKISRKNDKGEPVNVVVSDYLKTAEGKNEKFCDILAESIGRPIGCDSKGYIAEVRDKIKSEDKPYFVDQDGCVCFNTGKYGWKQENETLRTVLNRVETGEYQILGLENGILEYRLILPKLNSDPKLPIFNGTFKFDLKKGAEPVLRFDQAGNIISETYNIPPNPDLSKVNNLAAFELLAKEQGRTLTEMLDRPCPVFMVEDAISQPVVVVTGPTGNRVTGDHDIFQSSITPNAPDSAFDNTRPRGQYKNLDELHAAADRIMQLYDEMKDEKYSNDPVIQEILKMPREELQKRAYDDKWLKEHKRDKLFMFIDSTAKNYHAKDKVRLKFAFQHGDEAHNDSMPQDFGPNGIYVNAKYMTELMAQSKKMEISVFDESSDMTFDPNKTHNGYVLMRNKEGEYGMFDYERKITVPLPGHHEELSSLLASPQPLCLDDRKKLLDIFCKENALQGVMLYSKTERAYLDVVLCDKNLIKNNIFRVNDAWLVSSDKTKHDPRWHDVIRLQVQYGQKLDPDIIPHVKVNSTDFYSASKVQYANIVRQQIILGTPKHSLEVLDAYKKYQMNIHNDNSQVKGADIERKASTFDLKSQVNEKEKTLETKTNTKPRLN